MGTRGTVKADVKQWSQRKNLPDEVLNSFIEIALSRANWALRIAPLEKYGTLPISGTGYAQLPADFLEVKELYVTVNGYYKILDRKTINEVDSITNLAASGAYPEVFGRFGNYIRIAPWSLGTDSDAGLYYYAVEPQMEEDTASNWFTEFAPNILLYGALEELCDYTRDVEGSALWKSKFENEINIVQAVEDKAAWAGSSLAISMRGSIRERRSV